MAVPFFIDKSDLLDFAPINYLDVSNNAEFKSVKYHKELFIGLILKTLIGILTKE